jgi:hypothetical protein
MLSWRMLSAVLVLSALAAAPRPARALEDAQLEAAISGGVALGLVLGFGTYDLVIHERNQTPSRAAAIIETSAMSLQLALGISIAAVGIQRGDEVLLPVGTLMALVALPFLIHGTTSLRATQSVALRVTPTFASARGQTRAGVALVGAF